jgi:uncharacterized protein YjbI with pentapeptide repeats
MKIQIKNIFGSVLFEHEKENNTLSKTLIESVKSCADLRRADLRRADLSYANLSGAGLGYADLSGADLDFSCLHFSCKSRKPKTDERQRVQLCHHMLSWIKYSDNATDFEKSLFEFAKEYANRFHRNNVEKF